MDGENAPVDIPTGQSDGGNNFIDGLSSQVTLVCVKLTKRVTLPTAVIKYPLSWHARVFTTQEVHLHFSVHSFCFTNMID